MTENGENELSDFWGGVKLALTISIIGASVIVYFFIIGPNSEIFEKAFGLNGSGQALLFLGLPVVLLMYPLTNILSEVTDSVSETIEEKETLDPSSKKYMEEFLRADDYRREYLSDHIPRQSLEKERRRINQTIQNGRIRNGDIGSHEARIAHEARILANAFPERSPNEGATIATPPSEEPEEEKPSPKTRAEAVEL